MTKYVLCVLLMVGLYACWHDEPARWKGVPAVRDPLQTSENLPLPFHHDGFLVTPLARYAITAVVLSRERYLFDDGAKLSPLDLALGWGPMSVAGVINNLSISQGGRFYSYRWSDEAPLDPDQIVCHSANTHCLPADAKVRSRLLAVKRHEVVTMEGYLVEVLGPNNGHWRSSLTRTDTGGGACEVMWVTSVSSRHL